MTCQVCGSVTESFLTAHDYRLNTSTESWSVRKCVSCGHGRTIFQADRDFRGDYPESFYPKIKKVIRNPHGRLLERLLREKKINNVLDYGCGSGELIRYLSSRGFWVEGYDPYYKKRSSDENVLIHGDTEALVNKKFQAIMLMHVLEHEPDPRVLLESLKRLLADDGIIIVEVPNFESFQQDLLGAIHLHLDLPRHVHHFTRTSLLRQFDDVGLEVVSEKRLFPFLFPLAIPRSISNYLRFKGKLYLAALSKTLLFPLFPLYVFLNLISSSSKDKAQVLFFCLKNKE